MTPIQIKEFSQEKGPIVGIGFVAHESIVAFDPAYVSDGEEKVDVPIQFFRGNLNMIRAHLHKLIDDAMDALLDMQ